MREVFLLTCLNSSFTQVSQQQHPVPRRRGGARPPFPTREVLQNFFSIYRLAILYKLLGGGFSLCEVAHTIVQLHLVDSLSNLANPGTGW